LLGPAGGARPGGTPRRAAPPSGQLPPVRPPAPNPHARRVGTRLPPPRRALAGRSLVPLHLHGRRRCGAGEGPPPLLGAGAPPRGGRQPGAAPARTLPRFLRAGLPR